MKLCDDSKCLGCCACLNACPKSAIIMMENKYKAIIPIIDEDSCVGCGICQKVCPVIQDVSRFSVQKTYAAWSSQKEIVRTSASSGIVTALSLYVIENGGVVFGTRYERRRLIFDFTDNENDLKLFQGSKYTHAYIGNSYQRVKEFLESGRLVLFSGTPCQIAGLRKYLNKEYDNLITLDLICHGVAPNAYLDEYLKNIEYDNVLFRGSEGLKIVAYKNGKIVYSKFKLSDDFYSAYVNGMIHRENCYLCPYASVNRVGDITAGDFWGLKKDSLKNDASDIPYVSLILVNSDKGKEIIGKVQNYLIIEEKMIEEALGYNNQLNKPCLRHPERNTFLEEYEKKGFKNAINKTYLHKRVKKRAVYYSGIHILQRIKNYILR